MFRLLMSFYTALFMVLVSVSFVHAAAPIASVLDIDGARSFVEKVGNKALTDIAGKTEVTEEEARKTFRELLVSSFDMNGIARFTLGRYWKQATAKEQSDFKTELENLIVRSYTKRLKDYKGKSFEIVGASALSDKDVGVNMMIYPGGKNQTGIELIWRIRTVKGTFKIVDLSVEGVSMAVTQRTEFSAVIQRGGGQVKTLIDNLRAKDAIQ